MQVIDAVSRSSWPNYFVRTGRKDVVPHAIGLLLISFRELKWYEKSITSTEILDKLGSKLNERKINQF